MPYSQGCSISWAGIVAKVCSSETYSSILKRKINSLHLSFFKYASCNQLTTGYLDDVQSSVIKQWCTNKTMPINYFLRSQKGLAAKNSTLNLSKAAYSKLLCSFWTKMGENSFTIKCCWTVIQFFHSTWDPLSGQCLDQGHRTREGAKERLAVKDFVHGPGQPQGYGGRWPSTEAIWG